MLALGQRYLQEAKAQERIALLSSKQLLLEEELEKKQAAAKKAKKQKAKATKRQQKQQQQQQQSDSEPESESASEYVLKAPKAALFAVAPEAMGPEVNNNDWSISKATALSAKSESASEYVLKALKAVLFAVAPESMGPEVNNDDWSISKATALSAKRGLTTAPAISTTHSRRVPVVDSRLGHSSTSPDCVLAASEPPQPNLQPQARPSVTAEGSSSSAANLQGDSKQNRKVMDLYLCPTTQVLGFGSPQMHGIAEAIACWSVACKLRWQHLPEGAVIILSISFGPL